ncbi:N-acetylmuramoyl-L-alanine amidase [Eubacterium sp.]|uniref:N-acetylmuramoyl-L-alanine amidase n=1 Tax=Eubacterium sp. TaxID=142586 RepID=UPI0025882CB7|nr:N-acetylmuramoyl-L-alanine amidase [Eubacterium sp.]MCR5369039.1 N-acetylmuramoyl-L-alanine amidase [Eubacterium sp.]
MGTRTYKSDEFDRYSEREARKREWYRREMQKKRQALAILIGMGLAAIAVIAVIVIVFINLFSPKDTAEVENNLKNTPSSEISLVDNSSEDDFLPGSGSEGANGVINNNSQRGVIVIDPGHGGYDSGSVSALKYEKQIDLEIALLLSDKLKDKGFGVYLTRSDDNFVRIIERAELANQCEGAVALISIHQNSSDKDSDEGVEVWTSENEKNEQLAQLIVDEVSVVTGSINGGVKLQDNQVICNNAEMPAVIVQCGYLTNKRESKNLCDTVYQEKVASAIADAVDAFVPAKNK